MKIIHTADWHLGKILNDYSLLEDQKYYFDKFIEKLAEIKPDILLISGDVYDRALPSSEAVELLNTILSKIVIDLKIKTFIIAGNHDSKERLEFASSLLTKAGLYMVGNLTEKVAVFTENIEGKAVNIFMLPYTEPYNVKNIFKETQLKTHHDAINFYYENAFPKINKDEINLLLAHGSFFYSKNSESYIDEKIGGSEFINAGIFTDFDYVALGHIHSQKNIGKENMQYSGSPLKYSIDEASHSHEKSFTVITIEEEISYEKISIPPLREVIIKEGYFSDLMEDKSEDYIFINLLDNSTILNAINRLKANYPYILGLKYLNLNTKALKNIKIRKEKDLVELFGDFYSATLDEKIPEDDKAFIKSIFESVGDNKNDTD